jgi:spore coat protein U-like protein
MKKLLLSILTFTAFSFGANAQWTQTGSDIDGEDAGDLSGSSISLSNDGSIVAIAARENDGGPQNGGHVRIYQNISGTWTQLGIDLNGEAAADYSGYAVSLNGDGSIVAIGAAGNDGSGGAGANHGHVRVYQNVSGTWTQLGVDIDGEAVGDGSGYSVSLDNSGNTVAIGSINNDGNGTDAGHVRVYKNISGTWTQVGADIDGEAGGDKSASSISLSADGSIVAIGATDNNGNGTDAGHVRIYENISGTWTLIGADIDGEVAGDKSGSAVCLSNDGSIVAIAARENDGGPQNGGHVRIYENISGTWTQVGVDIDGEAAADYSGYSLSMNGDGSIVAIGAAGNDGPGGGGANHGHVRVYENVSGTWTKIDGDIDGETVGDGSGFSVALDSIGTTVAIGAQSNDGNGTDAGHVRIHTNGGVPCTVNIPDANFNTYLVGNTAINTNGDTEIQCSEASAFSGQIDCGGLSISDLTGIEEFTSLTVLWCDNNSLINLDVTNNLALIDLRCHNNSLSSIDVTLNSSLDNLSISYNSISSIDLSQNILLTGFYCFFNSFSNLDLTQTAVTTLRCHDNSLLTSLNFANGLNSNMADPSFQAHNNPNLTCIQVDNATYSTTNWTTYVDAGTSFSTNCSACLVNIPDANFKAYLVGNTAINTNADTEIQCSEANAFTGMINCTGLGIADLTGLEFFINLTDFRCVNSGLTSLNVSQNTALTTLVCNGNPLNTLDVSNNTALTTLYCYSNSLSTLDVSNNTALEILYCYSNSLSVLDVSNNNLITELKCHWNYTISALDVSNMASLNTLTCAYNSLASLDVSNNTQLTSFDCGNNVITSLNMSNNNAITSFACNNNSLNSLNMANGNNVNIPTSNFYTTNNPNLTCIEVDDVAYSTTNWTNIDAIASFSNNCGTVGINESNIKTMNIAPNPAKDLLNISTLETVEQVTIYSISGSLVKNINQNINQVNVEELTEGMYILVIKTENGITRNRFIKE